jgi:hypothetical protein
MLLMENLKNAPMRSSTEDVDGFEDRQEIIIDKGSTKTLYQSPFDTEISVDVLLPVQQSGETQSQFVHESNRNLVQVQ